MVKQGLLNAEELSNLLHMAKSSIYRKMESGEIPPPVRIGHCVRWRAAEIHAWIAAACPPRNKWDWDAVTVNA